MKTSKTAGHTHLAAADGPSIERPNNQASDRQMSKSLALCNGRGGLCALLLTGAQVRDIHGARALLSGVETPAGLIADKAYGADNVRALLAAHGITAVISHVPARRRPVDIDAIANKAPNITERTFSQQEEGGAIATQYNKMHETYSPPLASP